MVEIIPYTDDDEDQTNWVPLTSAVNDATRPAGGASATAAAATDGDASDDVSSEVNSDCGAKSANNSSRPGANKGSHDDIVLVEDADDGSDDEEGWQKLSAESPHPPATERSIDGAGASPVTEQSWSWGKQLITHLTSTKATTSTNEEDDASESGDNIVWRRANDLDDADVDAGRTYGRSNRQASIEEEYDDKTTPVLQFSTEEEFDESNLNTEPLRPQRGGRPRSGQARFQRVPEQTREQGDQARGRPSVKAKLQETLIHDPLRALPLCFLRHLYSEAKFQLTLAWDTYFEQNDLQTILAPVSLAVIVALLGMAMIGAGIFGLGSIVVGTSTQLILALCSWMVKISWTMAGQLLWVSMCASLVLGAVAWLWCRVGKRTDQNNGEAALKGFQVPSVSALLPWVIAATSPSLCEALVIILSLRTCLSVLAPGCHPDECSFATGGDDDRYCLDDTVLDQPSVSHGLSPLIMVSVALLMSVANALIVAAAANMMGQQDDQSGASTEGMSDGGADTTLSSPDGPGAVAVSSSSIFASDAKAYLRKSYLRMQSCIGTCHTVSVLALAALSVTAVLAKALYVHMKEGGNIFFALASHIGAVGCNILGIVSGVFVIINLWNAATEAVASNGTILARRISFGEIARIALRKAVIEISSNAVWSDDDTGSSLLGVLSDDDGTLRFAILEWAIDRWVTSSGSDYSVPTDQSAQQSAQGSSAAAAAENRQSRSGNFSKDNSSGHSSGDDQGRPVGNSSGDSNTIGSTNSDHAQILPSYQSLQELIVKLDADETLIPTIGRYREWVYSLPPSRNAAMYVALWKMCPATAVLVSTVLCCATSYVIRRIVIFSWGLVGTSNGCIAFVCTIATITLPLLFLEYLRVSRWWARATVHMENIKYEAQHNNERTQRDLVMILLRADAGDVVTSQSDFNIGFLVDTSNVLLRVWVLLLESISVLESSVPAVRCATVACAAADLTNNTVCLVDLALEVNKRGLLGGIGLMIWDAFHYHLSLELKQRRQETGDTNSDDADDQEELDGGQYTGAMVSAGRNLGRMSHNISCLMDQKNDGDDRKPSSDDNVSEDNEVESSQDTSSDQSNSSPNLVEEEEMDKNVEDPALEPTSAEDELTSEDQSDDSQKEDPKPCEESQGGDCATSCNQAQEKTSDDDNGGLMPFLIGGGLAIAGAVAGIAVHNAANSSSSEREKRRSGSSEESS